MHHGAAGGLEGADVAEADVAGEAWEVEAGADEILEGGSGGAGEDEEEGDGEQDDGEGGGEGSAEEAAGEVSRELRNGLLGAEADLPTGEGGDAGEEE